MTPDGAVLEVLIRVEAIEGHVVGALVEVEFSAGATALLAWSDPVPPLADIPVQTCPTRKYEKVTDGDGVATFHIAGGGCIRSEDFGGGTFIVQVRADDIVLAEREVNSPDVVNEAGRLCTEIGGPICDGGTMTVGLADGVFHTPHFATGSPEKCSDFCPPYDGIAELCDAVTATIYMKRGVRVNCFTGCP